MKRKLFLVLTVALALLSCNEKVDDHAAIIIVLEKESATWRSGDLKGHAACWKIQPYSKILVSTGDSTVLDVPPEYMISPPGGRMGNGGSFVNTNYKMNISGNNAWVSHNEESTASDGKKSYSYEIRILEKINMDWKLVGQSIHLYKPKIK